MSDQRSNRDEFLSFLGTCMTFYNMHLTPYEKDHVIAEIGKLLHDHLAPKNYAPLVKFLYGESKPIYEDTDMVKLRDAFTSGQTQAVMRDYKDFRDDPEMGGETDGKDGI